MEDTFKHSLSVILPDDMLEGFVGEGYGRTNDGIGNGLRKCPGYDDVSLIGFVVEYFSYKWEQK